VHALLAALANTVGGSTYPATTVALRAFPERDLIFVRMLVFAGLVAPFAWRGRARLLSLDRREALLCACAGVFGFALPLALGTAGQKLSSATSASLLIGMEPVAIVLLSALFLGERMTPWKLAAMALGLTGAAFIAFQGPPRLDGAFSGRLLGDLILVAHGACWALYTVIGKPVLRKLEPMDYAAATTLSACLATTAWGLLAGVSPGAWAAAPAASWGALAYLVVMGSFIGTWLWNTALRGLDASTQANFIFLQPLVGVLLGVGLLGDPFTRWTAGGGALVLAGVWAARK
jgi:drug/metabolite transporter (DMT)-like permease